MASFLFLVTPYTQNCKPLALVFTAQLESKSVLSLIAKLFIVSAKLKPTSCTFMDMHIHRHLLLRSENRTFALPHTTFLCPYTFLLQTNLSAWNIEHCSWLSESCK